MINLPSSQILSTDFAKYFSAKGPKILTGFVSDISNLPDAQKLECFHIMSAVVNKDAVVPQTSLPVMTICAPYITLVNLEVDQPESLSEKRKAAGEAGAKARWSQDGKPCDANGKNSKNSKNGKSHESHEKHDITCDNSDTYGKIILPSEHEKDSSNKILESNTVLDSNKSIREISKKEVVEEEGDSPDSDASNSSNKSNSSNIPSTTRDVSCSGRTSRRANLTLDDIFPFIPCPGNYDEWYAPAMAMARSFEWPKFYQWCMTGAKHDEDGCRRFYLAARRTMDRPNGITSKTLYKIYHHGIGSIPPLSARALAGFQAELDKITDADIEKMKREEQANDETPQTPTETASGATFDSTPCSASPSPNQKPMEPFKMMDEKELAVPEEDIIRLDVVSTPLPPLSGKSYFKTTEDYVTKDRGISMETADSKKVYVQGNYLHIPYRDWQGNPIMYTDKNGRQRVYEIIRNLALPPQASGCRYIIPAGVGKQPYNVEAFFNGVKTVFVTEGEIDALSVIDAGGECMADHDGEGIRILAEHIAQSTVERIIILADSDGTGTRKATSKYFALKKLGLAAKVVHMPQGCNDANDFLRMNRDAFTKTILDIMLEPLA